MINSIENQQKNCTNLITIKLTHVFRLNIENELDIICKEVLDLISNILLIKQNDTESKIFFYKMQADYYNYMSEYKNDEIIQGISKTIATENANKLYQEAFELEFSDNSLLNPYKLGLALSYSTFFYEIKHKKSEGYNLAKKIFNQALIDLDKLEDNQYKEFILILQLLQDNLSIWTIEMQNMENE